MKKELEDAWWLDALNARGRRVTFREPPEAPEEAPDPVVHEMEERRYELMNAADDVTQALSEAFSRLGLPKE